ncbi:MAG: hypothetical protein JNL83_27510 [Myxococcales bacterium]|nr:hypothetical protein [Myxococcales bacterium]
MLERQEIDALLISALYGELTPSEESRLAAHFEAHPADKTALATLTSTRDAVRESRILQVQVDPPPSITTVILQEAARRAPKQQEEREGWFARLAKAFMAHPAMAAAAMLVVVLGVTTLVNNRKGDHFAESTAPSSSQVASERAGSPASAGAQLGSGSAANADTIAAAEQQAPAMGGDGNDQYRVDLVEGTADTAATRGLADAGVLAQAEEQELDDLRRQKEAVKAELAKQQDEKKLQSARDEATVASATGAKSKAPAAKGTGSAAGPSGAYLEVRPAPQAAPKDLDGAPDPAGRVYDYEDDLAKENVNAVTPGPSAPSMTPGSAGGGAPSTGGAATAPRQGYAQPPANSGKVAGNVKADAKPEPKPADTRTGETQTKTVTQSPTTTAPRGNAAPPKAPAPPPPAKTATTTPAKTPPAKTPARPTTPPAEKPRAIAPAEDKAANDSQLAWSREQHMAIVAKVRAGDCQGAASIAVVLANRDFAYYRQNVATDRSVRECLAYIDNAREKDQEQRAERSRKKSLNEPAAPKASKPTASDAAQFVK